ncbi:MAG TPA: anti-sigma factor, partial [Saprospiraceae bacterium]|nr:anti-sigma factor [Saprospiraceae bacterium]
MDIKAYISSGILELYCAGALTERENREVETMARQYPEVKKEIDSIHNALNQYANKFAANPSPGLKEKILNQITDKSPLSANLKPASVKSNSLLYFGLIAATVVAIFFYYKWSTSSINTNHLNTENINLAKENLDLITSLNGCHEQMDILLSKDTKLVPLGGLPISPTSKVFVYWNSVNKNTYINVSNLPSPPADKQYQLWALAGGKPIDAGVFEANTGTLQNLKKIESAEAFAVTLEKKGGSTSPTMDQMYVMGKI